MIVPFAVLRRLRIEAHQEYIIEKPGLLEKHERSALRTSNPLVKSGFLSIHVILRET